MPPAANGTTTPTAGEVVDQWKDAVADHNGNGAASGPSTPKRSSMPSPKSPSVVSPSKRASWSPMKSSSGSSTTANGLTQNGNGRMHTSTMNVAPQSTIEKLGHAQLLQATTWDVFTPAPTNSIKGKVVPRIVNKFKNRRKLSLEVHRVTPAVTSVSGNREVFSYEECVLR